MNTYITSDPHFGHKNIIKYNPKYRQFSSIDEMDSSMMSSWNSLVKPEDLVYILGDFAFHKPGKATEVAMQLNGRKILITGNHDYDMKLVKYKPFIECFEEITNYKEIKFNGHKICMMHYPICEWHNCHHGSIMLHGHLHGKPSGLSKYRVRDVGFDATGNIVSLLDDIVADALTGKIKYHGWKNMPWWKKLLTIYTK